MGNLWSFENGSDHLGRDMTGLTNLGNPSVGIFWRVSADAGGSCLIADSVPLQKAEAYGDCLTYPGSHYDVWERCRRRGQAKSSGHDIPRSVIENEYETFPRGRIVFHQPSQTFWIYADRRIQKWETLEEIRARFGLLEARCETRSDAHYR